MLSLFESLNCEHPEHFAYTAVIFAYLLVWKKKAVYWQFSLIAYLIFGYLTNCFQVLGVLLIVSFWGGVVLMSRVQSVLASFCMGVLILAWIVLAKLHMLPGFNNLIMYSGLQLSIEAIPYTLYLNFETPIIGVLLLAYIVPKASNFKAYIRALRNSWQIMSYGVVTVMMLAMILGFVGIDLKYPEILFVWVILNIITVITEETIFRGWLLRVLLNYTSPALSIMCVSILFGILHFSGGALYMLLAMISGVFYSWVYVKTKSIEASSTLHFLLNFIHIMIFTYPALASVYS